MTAAEGVQHCGIVAVVGAPNAGKSTLVNQLVGAKVSIVTHKVQTTRTRLRGIAIEGDSQIVFVDTPGIFTAKRRLERAMVQAAWSGIEDADIVLVIHDAGRKQISEETRLVIDGLAKTSSEIVLVLNKIDLVKREKLLDLAAELSELGKFRKVQRGGSLWLAAYPRNPQDDSRWSCVGLVRHAPFLLINHSGQPVGSAEVSGKVTLIDLNCKNKA
jgi:GTP-binding protein Era